MFRNLKSALFTAVLCAFTGCSTVTDLVVTSIPDHHQGRARIVIDLRDQQATLYKGHARIAVSRVSTGREGHGTPAGTFNVCRKDEDHRSGIYGDYVDDFGRVIVANVDSRIRRAPRHTHFRGASMPFFIEFSPGYGLHAGYLPGFPASHGCVRMPFWKARQFFNAVRIGTTVVVRT